jgi:hypothetical protein
MLIKMLIITYSFSKLKHYSKFGELIFKETFIMENELFREKEKLTFFNWSLGRRTNIFRLYIAIFCISRINHFNFKINAEIRQLKPYLCAIELITYTKSWNAAHISVLLKEKGAANTFAKSADNRSQGWLIYPLKNCLEK